MAFIFLLLFFLPSGVWADTRCQVPAGYRSPQRIKVTLNIPKPRLVTTQLRDKIEKSYLAAPGNDPLPEGFGVAGSTSFNPQSDMELSFRYISSSYNDEICFWVEQLKVDISAKNFTVHIPREYESWSCEYRAVKKHEMRHVDINKQSVRRYRNDLRDALHNATEIPSLYRPWRGTDVENLKQRARGEAQKLLERESELFSKRMMAMHEKFDKEELRRKSPCKEWKRDKIPHWMKSQ